jgi:hypothetical protein
MGDLGGREEDEGAMKKTRPRTKRCKMPGHHFINMGACERNHHHRGKHRMIYDGIPFTWIK